MSDLLILPNGRGTTQDYPEFEPGYQPRAPVCGDCGREATPKNPVGVQLRRSWNPLDKNPRAGLDARCAECREKTARFRR